MFQQARSTAQSGGSMTVRYMRRLRQLSPTIVLYFVTIAVVGFAIDGGVYAVLLNLFLVRLGYRPESIGLVNAAGTLTFALSSLPAGALGARWGSRRMLLIGLGLMLAGSVLLPLADTFAPARRLAWLLANDIVLYLGLALYFVNTAPYVMEVVGAQQRNQIFSFQTALLSLASFVGSLAGGFLPPVIATLLGVPAGHPAPYRYALIVAGLALLPAMFAIRAAPHGVKTREETPVALSAAAPPPAAARPILGLLATIALVRLLQVSGLATTSTFFNVYLDSALLVPTAQIGTIIAIGRLLGVPAALTTAALAARFGNRRVVIGASIGTALSLLPLALIPHWGAAGLSFIGVVGFSWIRYAASLVYFLELVPPARRATVSGVAEMAAGVCFTVMTFGGGYMIALLGYRSLFLAGAALTGLSALAFWLSFRGRAAGTLRS
jgi:MFS family permease